MPRNGAPLARRSTSRYVSLACTRRERPRAPCFNTTRRKYHSIAKAQHRIIDARRHPCAPPLARADGSRALSTTSRAPSAPPSSLRRDRSREMLSSLAPSRVVRAPASASQRRSKSASRRAANLREPHGKKLRIERLSRGRDSGVSPRRGAHGRRTGAREGAATRGGGVTTRRNCEVGPDRRLKNNTTSSRPRARSTTATTTTTTTTTNTCSLCSCATTRSR